MNIRKISYSSKFLRSLKSLDPSLQPLVIERSDIFIQNCFDPRLRTHKLKGRLSGYWSFSLTHAHRVVFEIIEDGVVGFVDIGDHSIYR